MLLKINVGYSHGLQFWSATMVGGGWLGRRLRLGGRDRIKPKAIDLTAETANGVTSTAITVALSMSKIHV